MKGETSAAEIWGKGHRRRERSSDSGSFCLRDKKGGHGTRHSERRVGGSTEWDQKGSQETLFLS